MLLFTMRDLVVVKLQRKSKVVPELSGKCWSVMKCRILKEERTKSPGPSTFQTVVV